MGKQAIYFSPMNSDLMKIREILGLEEDVEKLKTIMGRGGKQVLLSAFYMN